MNEELWYGQAALGWFSENVTAKYCTKPENPFV